MRPGATPESVRIGPVSVSLGRVMRRSALTILASLGAAIVVGWFGFRRAMAPAPVAPATGTSCATGPSTSAPSDDGRTDGGKASDRLAGRSLQLPTGAPAGLSCRDARRVVGQARVHLAADPEQIDARALADATVDWLDPHGLWSASPDAPLSAFLRKHDRELVRELEVPAD